MESSQRTGEEESEGVAAASSSVEQVLLEEGQQWQQQQEQQQEEPCTADESSDVSVSELVYSVESFNAIYKPVLITMVLSALAVCYINTPETQEEGEAAISNTYNVYGNAEESGETDGEKMSAALVNALVIVGVVCVMTFMIVLLYKYRCMKTLLGYMVLSSCVLLGYVSAVMFQVAIERYTLYNVDAISFWLFIYNFAAVGTAAIYFSNGFPNYITQAYLIATSVIVAWQLSFFDSWTAWALLIMLALYDLFAVLTPCGPLKALVKLMQKEDAPDMPGLLYEANLPQQFHRHRPQAARSPQQTPPTPQRDSAISSSLSTAATAAEVSSSLSTAAVTASSTTYDPNDSTTASMTTQQSTEQEIEHNKETPRQVEGGGDPLCGTSSSVVASGRITTESTSTVAADAHPPPLPRGDVFASYSSSVATASTLELTPLVVSPRCQESSTSSLTSSGNSNSNTERAPIASYHHNRTSSLRQPPIDVDSCVPVVEVLQEDEEEGIETPPTAHIPLVLAKMYKLRLVDNPQPRWLVERAPADPATAEQSQQTRPTTAGTVDGDTTTVEAPQQDAPETATTTTTYTPEELCSLVHVVFPVGGGRIQPQQQQQQRGGGGERSDEPIRYDVIDRNGSVRRSLIVNEQGKVFRIVEQQQQGGNNKSKLHERNTIKLGLGDFIFYSILVAEAAVYSYTTFAACTLAILSGLGMTLLLLAMYGKALPALPISIYMGVVFFLLTRYLIQPWIQTIFIEQVYV